MVTMAEVAARAGVTKQTVSNVVTGRVRVRPETAERVRSAIAELGYTPNLVARSLATGSTKTVGLLVPWAANAFYSEVIETVEDVLEQHGYHLLLCTTRADGERARRQLDGLSSRNVDALLIAGDKDLIDHLPLLDDKRFPVALCAWETEVPDTLPVVTIDYEHAGFLAGRHLRELGHERVAVIGDLPAHALRVEGLRRAFAADGLTVPDRLVLPAPSDDMAGGITAATAALAAEPELTAVFATHDILALGAMEAVIRAGMRVPDDVSVVGLDDIPQGGYAEPALTTIAIPKREMAQQAVELLLRAVKAGKTPANAISMLRPDLIVRGSSAPPHRAA